MVLFPLCFPAPPYTKDETISEPVEDHRNTVQNLPVTCLNHWKLTLPELLYFESLEFLSPGSVCRPYFLNQGVDDPPYGLVPEENKSSSDLGH